MVVTSEDGGEAITRRGGGNIPRPSLFDLGKFAVFAGVTFLAAWVAGTGRVAYTFIMLVIAAALAYAVLDLIDYELVKRKRRAETARADESLSQAGARTGAPPR